MLPLAVVGSGGMWPTVLSAFGPNKVVFYDWDVVEYYYRLIHNFYDGYSWQVRVSYGLIVFSILLMMLLFLMFAYRVIKRNRRARSYKHLEKAYGDKFREILGEVELLTPSEIEQRCGVRQGEFQRYHPSLYVKLITHLREELMEVIYIPNLQTLSHTCGMIAYLENNLLNTRRVFETVQTLTTLNLRISEGRLANYVNHRNLNIRHMARMSYMICSDMEPYRYLTEDLNDEMAPWRPMALHQLFGWLQTCAKRMPNMLTLVNRVSNPKVAAFVIEEVAYWGSDSERTKISDFFLDDRYECRSAAFKAIAMLRDDSQEDAMVATYDQQPEPLRREILGAIHSLRTGKYTDFFNQVYHASPSKETRETALTYLYDYNNESRRLFEHLRFEDNGAHRLLIDQIDSLNLLNQIRNYS